MIYSFDRKQPRISNDAFVSDSADIIGDVIIDDHCYIGPQVVIRGDGECIHICEGAAVEDGVVIHTDADMPLRIGKRATLGHGAVVHGTVDDYAIVGMNAVVSIGAQIGEWAIVGEGSVVKMNQVVEPRTVVVGAPAQEVRTVLKRDIDYWVDGKQYYVDLARACQSGKLAPFDPSSQQKP